MYLDGPATENYAASTLKVYGSILITILRKLTQAQTDCTRPPPQNGLGKRLYAGGRKARKGVGMHSLTARCACNRALVMETWDIPNLSQTTAQSNFTQCVHRCHILFSWT